MNDQRIHGVMITKVNPFSLRRKEAGFQTA